MTREQELIAEYEAAMNAPLSERDKELIISVLKWADNHPNWNKVDEELPPPISVAQDFSDSIIVTDGVLLCQGYYSHIGKSWGWEIEGDIDSDEVTHWMYLPNLPKED